MNGHQLKAFRNAKRRKKSWLKDDSAFGTVRFGLVRSQSVSLCGSDFNTFRFISCCFVWLQTKDERGIIEADKVQVKSEANE